MSSESFPDCQLVQRNLRLTEMKSFSYAVPTATRARLLTVFFFFSCWQYLRFNSGLRNCTANSHYPHEFFCFSLNTPHHGAYCQDMCKENIHSHSENRISANLNIWVRALKYSLHHLLMWKIAYDYINIMHSTSII